MWQVFNWSYCPAGTGFFFLVCGEFCWSLYSQSWNNKYGGSVALHLAASRGLFSRSLKTLLLSHTALLKRKMPQQPERRVDSPQPSERLDPSSPVTVCALCRRIWRLSKAILPSPHPSPAPPIRPAHVTESINFHGAEGGSVREGIPMHAKPIMTRLWAVACIKVVHLVTIMSDSSPQWALNEPQRLTDLLQWRSGGWQLMGSVTLAGWGLSGKLFFFFLPPAPHWVRWSPGATACISEHKGDLYVH